MACLRSESQPHDVAPIGHVPAGHYQDSPPTRGPVSTPGWRVRSVILPRSCFNVTFFPRTGGATILPSQIHKSSVGPSPTAVSSPDGLGIRNPGLFPPLL